MTRPAPFRQWLLPPRGTRQGLSRVVDSWFATMTFGALIQNRPATARRSASWLLVGVALLLLTAAALKVYELATVPLENRGWLIVQVTVEWLISAWLLSGIYRRAGWFAALTLFCIFSGVAAHQALERDRSCGCFGPVRLDPKYTLVLDLTVVGGLLATGRGVRATTRPPEWQLMLATTACVVGIGVAVILAVRGLPPLARPLWVPPDLTTRPSS